MVGGLALVIAGGAGAVWGLRTAASARRPVAVLAALATPIAIGVALAGGVLVFVPGFFGAAR